MSDLTIYIFFNSGVGSSLRKCSFGSQVGDEESHELSQIPSQRAEARLRGKVFQKIFQRILSKINFFLSNILVIVGFFSPKEINCTPCFLSEIERLDLLRICMYYFFNDFFNEIC